MPGIADKFTQSAQARLRAGHDDAERYFANLFTSSWPGFVPAIHVLLLNRRARVCNDRCGDAIVITRSI